MEKPIASSQQPIASYRYYKIHKPFGVLSQFTKELPEHITLADHFDVPKDVYPVGRLDKDSEGLLVLTNDPTVNQLLLDPKHAHKRTYWVQVEGEPTSEALAALQRGVSFRIKGKIHRSRPALAEMITPSPDMPDRTPPVRFRKNIPTTWMSLTLHEGKNRQVRRMCAAVGFPVLRLMRVSIGDLELGTLPPGKMEACSRKDIL
ncbi:MAG: pseudouridine synthase [Bacteroidia bacterium]